MSDFADDDTGEAKVSSSPYANGPEPGPSSPKIANFAQTDDGLSQDDPGLVLAERRPPSERIVSETDEGTAASYSSGTRRDTPETGAGTTTRAEFTTAFDIIDEMQHCLAEAKSSFFSADHVRINRTQLSGYLDELKTVLPVQLERASALMRESERRLETAQNQAESILRAAQHNSDEIIAKANEQADFLAGHQNVVALAEEKARDILTVAQRKADKVVQGSNEYSSTVLEGLEAELEKMTRDVRAGLSVLRGREQEAAAKLERIDLAAPQGSGANRADGNAQTGQGR